MPSDEDEQFGHTGSNEQCDPSSAESVGELTQITIMVDPRYYDFSLAAASKEDQPVFESGSNQIDPEQLDDEVDPLSL